MIELGDGTTPAPEPPAAAPGVSPRVLRQLLAGLVVLVTLLAATGSTSPGRAGVHPLWSVPWTDGDVPVFTGSTLYLGRQDGNRALLTAYDLATGRPRWETPAGGTVTYFSPPTEGVLVMPIETITIGTSLGESPPQHHTVGRDAATGRTLWTQLGEPLNTSPAGVLLTETDPQGRLTGLRLVGLHDGTQLWERPVHAVDSWGFDADPGGPQEILLADKVGNLTVLGYADGRVRQTGRLHWEGPDPAQGEVFTTFFTEGDQLYVSRGNNAATSNSVTTAYRRDDLRELWHAAGYSVDCGPLVCTAYLQNPLAGNGDTLIARDPATGAERWQVAGPADAMPVGGGRLLAGSAGPTGLHRVLDAATGRTIGNPVRGDNTYAGDSFDGGRSALLLGPLDDAGRLNPVIQLDLTTGISYLLGSVAEPGRFDCQGLPGYLACWRPGSLDITRIRTTAAGGPK